jgi:hypothetical protein
MIIAWRFGQPRHSLEKDFGFDADQSNRAGKPAWWPSRGEVFPASLLDSSPNFGGIPFFGAANFFLGTFTKR